MRTLLCEGPDDLTALREIGTHIFGAIVVSTRRPPGGLAQSIVLKSKTNVRIEITSSTGKSPIPGLVANQLLALPPQIQGDPEQLSDLGIAFDPDAEDPETTFIPDVEKAVADNALDWTLSARGAGPWVATRQTNEVVTLHPLPWRGTTDPVDGLADEQNLERLLCAIAAKAYPTEAALVDSWLTAFPQTRKRNWKSALHLWCALVECKANELNAPARFLHQNDDCKPHVQEILKTVGLIEPLTPLFT